MREQILALLNEVLPQIDFEASDKLVTDGILDSVDAMVKTVKGIREQVNKLQNFPESHELDDDPILAKLGGKW